MPVRRSRRSGRVGYARSEAWLPCTSSMPVVQGQHIHAAVTSMNVSRSNAQAETKPVAAACKATTPSVTGSNWQRYASMEDADAEQVSKIHAAVTGKELEFVAVEKVHGSNFAFETNGGDIQYFSRSRSLEPSEKFVGRTCSGEAMQQYHGAVLQTFRLCNESFAAGVTSVIVYGEYFGGWYPHPDVNITGPGAGTPVQKGIVAYSPLHHFFAFDLYVDGIACDFDFAMDLLTRAGFPLVAKPLIRGTFEDCMTFDIESLHSTLPKLLGLPMCEDFSIAEGVIVKPVQPRKSWTLKRKSVRYLEACPDELRKWIVKCSESPVQALQELYMCLCRRPRLEAVLSKDPQLRENLASTLQRIQVLFREDLETNLWKKLAAAKVTVPEMCLDAVRAQAERQVVAWLLQDASGR